MIDLTALPKPTIPFTAIGADKVAMAYGAGGHLLLDIGHGSQVKKETRLAGETVEVFHQLKARDFNVEAVRIMKSKLRKKVQKMQKSPKNMDELFGKNCGRARGHVLKGCL